MTKTIIALILGLFCISHAQYGDEVIQNALLEGVQLSVEDGENPGEQSVSCYFIFRDKPTSYFYNTLLKEGKIVFEFNDTELGSSPIISSEAGPLTGFRVEQRRVDVNKEVRGLKPEWHDMVQVTFTADKMPILNVTDEYSIISFVFPWHTDPKKQDDLIVKSNRAKGIVWTSLSLFAGIGGGFIAWYVLQPDEPDPLKELETGDLPNRGEPLSVLP